MRIIECYIENFGKISKKKYEFKDGLNCIKEDNGSGKTTLAAFIKVMLYGMNDTKRLSLDENERKHYLPWQGGVCGGSITFESGGRKYRAERSFGAKASDDTLIVYDTATGHHTEKFADGIGETLFGIDADGFERTVFLSERALTPKSENKSISAKLSDLVGCDGDIGAMDDAMKILEERRKFYYKKGGSGELADTKAKIDEIQRRLNTLGEVELALDAARGKMSAISLEIDAARAQGKILLKEREDATVKAAKADYGRQYSEMKLSLEESLRKRTAFGGIWGAEVPSFTNIDEASYKATEAKNLEAGIIENPERIEFESLSKKFDGRVDRAKIDEAKAAIKAITEQKERENNPALLRAKKIFKKRIPTATEIDEIEALASAKRTTVKPWAIVAYIVSVAAIGIGAVLMPMVSIIGLLGAVATTAAVVIAGSRAKKKRENTVKGFFNSVSEVDVESQDEVAARIRDMRSALEIIEASGKGDTEKYNKILTDFILLFPDRSEGEITACAEAIIKEYERYAELAVAERYIMGDRRARAERAAQLRAEADAFLRRFNLRTAEPFAELRAALTEYNRLTAEIVAKRDEMERLESLNTIGEGDQQKARADIAKIDQKRHENDEHIANLSREYALAERLYSSYSEELEMRDELTMRRAELEEILEKHKDNYETILLTKKYITTAKDNMTARYLGKTKAGFLMYAEMIGGISGESFEMDTDFGITKQEGASTRSVEAYSRGTRDLFNLAARLALVDSLYEKDRPFIILDDPFTAFDDKKVDSAIKLLRGFAKERQIIYFTCSKSRSV